MHRNFFVFHAFSALVIIFFSALTVNCNTDSKQHDDDFKVYLSYKDVPGVTNEEIAAIENLRAQYEYFTFGMPVSIEAYKDQNGELNGFAQSACLWLSELFGIPFRLSLYEWPDLMDGLQSGEISFTGELTFSEDNIKNFYQTSAVFSRPIKYYRLVNSKSLNEISEERLPLYGFIEDTAVIDAVTSELEEGTYEIVTLRDFNLAYNALHDGVIDAFFYTTTADVHFIEYDDIVSLDFYPLIRIPASMSTQTKALIPVINIMEKALQTDVYRYLTEMYNKNNRKYQKYKLYEKLTNEEIEYIKRNPVIPFSADFDNYPTSFYDTRSNKWAGMGFDVLEELKELTGLDFILINDHNARFFELLEKLENGESRMHLELIYSKEREGRFLWSSSGYKTDYPALISKLDHRNVDIHEIYSIKIGLSKGTVYTELFKKWFPNHNYIYEYERQSDSFDALLKGEVDMVMNSYSGLLYLTHYREFPDYKINILFDDSYKSTFGFYKEEAVLCSIIDKALKLIDTDSISNLWIHRVFDYRIKLANLQRFWLVILLLSFLCILTLIIVLFLRNRRSGKILEQLVSERTSEIELQTVMLNALFDSIPDLVFTKDLNLNYMHINKSLMEYFGVRREDVIGKDDVEGLGAPLEIAKKHIEMDNAVINERKAVVCEEIIKSRQGVSNLYETIKIPLIVNGIMVGFLGISRDITKRKEAEEAAIAASRSKSEFLAIMSHEIRTPMNSIVGFSELALDGNISPKTREYLEKIIENSEGLLQIINDILDISKVESGRMELEKIPFNMHELLESCQSIIMPKANEKSLLLHFYAEPHFGRMPLGDPTRLRQVIINLLSNAVKFTNSGMIKFFVEIIKITESSVTMHFEVKDSGIGMTKEQINKIFYPFTQAETGTTRKFGGTGLGLPITKNIIELMGGEIFVESTPGIGSKFYFDLTFDTMDTSKDNKFSEKLVIKDIKKPYFKGEILVCEDNAMNQQVICEHLIRIGLNTVVAANGKIGVDIIQSRADSGEKQFDLILMDMNMPIMDGIEASKKIFSITDKVPIVAMTANLMQNDKEIYNKIGINDCIGKPFTSQELWYCLLKYLTPEKEIFVENTAFLENEMEFQVTLMNSFMTSNKNKFIDLQSALSEGDIKQAHRLAHTLKSNAGQIGEEKLQKLAQEVESALKEGKNKLTENLLKKLGMELNSVLSKIAEEFPADSDDEDEIIPAEQAEVFDVESARVLFDALEPMLERGNPESNQIIKNLRAIPGTEVLIQQLEDFDYEPALNTLVKLRKDMGII